jgi:hypothetical protein
MTPVARYPGDPGVPAQVIGPSGCEGMLRVVVGIGCGQADGGFETDLPAHRVPVSHRLPNARFRLAVDTSGAFCVLKVGW